MIGIKYCTTYEAYYGRTFCHYCRRKLRVRPINKKGREKMRKAKV
jgi:hypothetical protein